MLAEAELAPLVPAVAQLTGDYTLLREDLRPDPALVLEPEGGLTEDQLAEIRELLFGALSRWREAGSPPAPDPTDDELRRLMAYLITDDGLVAEYFSVLREELAIDGATCGRPTGTRTTSRPTRRSRSRSSAPACRACVAAHRLGRRASPFVVFEKNADVGGTWFENTLPGLPRRRAEPPVQLLVRADGRLAAVLLRPGRAARLLPRVRRRARPAPAHPLRDRGARRPTFDDDDGDVARAPAGRRRGAGDARRSRRSSARSASSTGRSIPDIAGRDAFAGACVPLRAVGPRRRPRTAGGSRSSAPAPARRSSSPSSPSRPPSSSSSSARAPGWSRTPNYHDELPDGVRWLLATCPCYAHVGSAVAVLADARGPAAGGRRRPGVGRQRALGQRGQRARPRAVHRVPQGRVRRPPELLAEGRARLPADREAHRARQRHLGADADARQRRAGRPSRSREITEQRRAHGRRRARRASTSSSTAPGSRRRSS